MTVSWHAISLIKPDRKGQILPFIEKILSESCKTTPRLTNIWSNQSHFCNKFIPLSKYYPGTSTVILKSPLHHVQWCKYCDTLFCQACSAWLRSDAISLRITKTINLKWLRHFYFLAYFQRFARCKGVSFATDGKTFTLGLFAPSDWHTLYLFSLWTLRCPVRTLTGQRSAHHWIRSFGARQRPSLSPWVLDYEPAMTCMSVWLSGRLRLVWLL